MKRATLRVQTNVKVVEYLRQLVDTGLYGRNESEAAERLVCEGLSRRLAPDGRAIERPMLREL